MKHVRGWGPPIPALNAASSVHTSREVVIKRFHIISQRTKRNAKYRPIAMRMSDFQR